jgi:hypothetical protein
VIIRKPEVVSEDSPIARERYAYNNGEYLAKNIFAPAGIRLREERDARALHSHVAPRHGARLSAGILRAGEPCPPKTTRTSR